MSRIGSSIAERACSSMVRSRTVRCRARSCNSFCRSSILPAPNRRSMNWEGGCRQVIDQISALPKMTTRRGWLVIRAACGKKGTMVRGQSSSAHTSALGRPVGFAPVTTGFAQNHERQVRRSCAPLASSADRSGFTSQLSRITAVQILASINPAWPMVFDPGSGSLHTIKPVKLLLRPFRPGHNNQVAPIL